MGSKVNVAVSALLAAALLVVVPAHHVLANGGTIQLSGEPTGPFAVSVFTDPNPIRVGQVDVSVLVQRAGGTFPATHEQATNKLYYAANVFLPTDGRWRITVGVSGPKEGGTVAFEVEASQAGILDKPLAVAVAVAVPALAVLVLAARRRANSPAPFEKEKGET